MAAGLPTERQDSRDSSLNLTSVLSTVFDPTRNVQALLTEFVTLIPYRPNEMFYCQGAPILGIHIIVEGLVKIVRRMLSGKSRLITVLGAGEVAPPYALAQRGRHLTSCIVLKLSRAALIEREIFRTWLESHPKIAVELLEEVGHKFKSTLGEWTRTDYYAGIQQKLAYRLLETSRGFGIPHSDGSVLINLPLTQQDWADWIGNSRERTTEMMGDWQERGILARLSQPGSPSDTVPCYRSRWAGQLNCSGCRPAGGRHARMDQRLHRMD